MDLQTTASKRLPARTLLVAALVVVALAATAASASAASGAAQVYLGLRATGAGSAVGVDPTGVLDHCADDGHCYFRFDAGTVVTLAVSTTDPAASFVRWLGACTGSKPTCSVRLDRSRNVTARFSPVQFDVTSTPGEGTVEISPGGPSCGAGCTSFAYGDRVGLAAHACCGYSFDHWIGPCASVASASCRFTIYEPVEATPVFRCDGDC